MINARTVALLACTAGIVALPGLVGCAVPTDSGGAAQLAATEAASTSNLPPGDHVWIADALSDPELVAAARRAALPNIRLTPSIITAADAAVEQWRRDAQELGFESRLQPDRIPWTVGRIIPLSTPSQAPDSASPWVVYGGSFSGLLAYCSDRVSDDVLLLSSADSVSVQEAGFPETGRAIDAALVLLYSHFDKRTFEIQASVAPTWVIGRRNGEVAGVYVNFLDNDGAAYEPGVDGLPRAGVVLTGTDLTASFRASWCL